MNDVIQWHYETIGNKTVTALVKNGFAAAYFADRYSAVDHVMSLIPSKATVGIGGSVSTRELGLGKKLAGKSCTMLDHQNSDLTPEKRREILRGQLTCNIFLTSSNAVTMNGELLNRDGNGNRVAAMIYGPDKVVVVVGANKITRDLTEAESRLAMFACPMNNKRLNFKNPCVKSGVCVNCNSETSICNVTTIISRRPKLTDFHVVIIGETLGY
ncbi:MAG: lactate utilization protein [Desulfovibrio sp.]|nr:lactate utilization protein [Desulfovibrio sp.]